MDIEEIRQGRRRNWDALKEPEEKSPAGTAPGDAPAEGAKHSLNDVDRRRLAESDGDRAQWLAARRQIWLVIAGVVGIFFLSWGVGFVRDSIADSRRKTRVMELNGLINGSKLYLNLSTPLDAWASWRSAWLHRNAAQLLRMRPPDTQMTIMGRMPMKLAAEQQQRLMDIGAMDIERQIATGFTSPIPIRNAPALPRKDDLAVFESGEILRANAREEPSRWVVAFCYDPGSKEWRLLEARKRAAWRPAWHTRQMVQPLRVAYGREQGFE